MFRGRSLARRFADGIDLKNSSQLQVVHTNQWPIPYYKRYVSIPRNLYPDNDYNVNISNTTVGAPDDLNVYETRKLLETSMKGREILAAMQADVYVKDWKTRVNHPETLAETYMEDLLQHIDYPQQENARILKKHRLGDVFN